MLSVGVTLTVIVSGFMSTLHPTACTVLVTILTMLVVTVFVMVSACCIEVACSPLALLVLSVLVAVYVLVGDTAIDNDDINAL